VVRGGTVTNTKSTSVSGSGGADLRFTTKGEFAVVVEVDCSGCRGSFGITTPDRMSPLGRNTAPLKTAYLISVFKDDSPQQSVLITAAGRWRVTFRSWNDLPVERGKLSGKGSTVRYLGDRAKSLKVTYRPAANGDSFGGRIFTVSDRPQVFGNDEAFTETFKTDLPGVIAITTNGSWTITPR
jgi:hypothetical protein